jgi:hypothetical protein
MTTLCIRQVTTIVMWIMKFKNTQNNRIYEFVAASDTAVLVKNDKGEQLRLRPEYFKQFFVDPNSEEN